MSRTRPLTLVLLWIAGAAAGFVVDAVLAGAGRPILHLPATLGIALAAIGVVLVAAAWPVRQAVRDAKRRVGFRHATSVLGLAKASAILAAVAGGWASGVLLYLLTRPVVPGEAALMALIGVGGAVVLLVAALLAESWCMLPPDDDGAAPAAG